jgi:archaellum biogenesis protein FlaJ (TadC family)
VTNIRLAKFIYGFVWLLITLTVAILLTMPFLFGWYTEMTGMLPADPMAVMILLYTTAIPFLILLVMALRLSRNILRHTPFTHSSTACLQVASLSAFVNFLLYAYATLFVLQNLLSLAVMVVFFTAGLVSLILSQLVKMAREMQEENDLTI